MVSATRPGTEAGSSGAAAPQRLAELWGNACDTLGVVVPDDDTPATFAVAHDISISLNIGQGNGTRTEFTTHHDAPGLPAFSVTKRTSRAAKSALLTGDEKFDESVVIKADDHAAVARFLTAERRMAISHLFAGVPAAQFTHTHITAWTHGIEQDRSKVSSIVRRVIEASELLRPSWADVALDEGSVFDDLFHANRELDGITQRFNELYLGNHVNWTGEVLTVGATDVVGTRVAVLLGAARSESSTGRVVALTAVDPSTDPVAGDIATVAGSMWRLDPGKRLFTIE